MNRTRLLISLFVFLALNAGPTFAQIYGARPPVFVRHWKPDVTSEFEVGTQVRAWTIHDEGMDYILDNLQQMCGVNSLCKVADYMRETSPFSDAAVSVQYRTLLAGARGFSRAFLCRPGLLR